MAVEKNQRTSGYERSSPAAPVRESSEHAVLRLQRSAGNHALSKLLSVQRHTDRPVVQRKKDDQARVDNALDAMKRVHPPLEQAVRGHPKLSAALGAHLSLERNSRGTGKERRSLIRAAMLAYLTVGNRATGTADTLLTGLLGMSKADLRIVLGRFMPSDVAANAPGRTGLPAIGASKEQQKQWRPSNFTDPTRHRPDKPFRYVVIALQNQAKDKNRAYNYKDFLENPGILENFVNSTSLIDQEHRGTYTPYGLILKVPAANFAVANPKDISIANQSTDIEREIETKHATHGLPSPEEVLEGTVSKSKNPVALPYNEVVVRGRTGQGVIKVTGVFVKTKQGQLLKPINAATNQESKDPYVSDDLMNVLRKTAGALGVPIVYIDEADPSQDRLESVDPTKGEASYEVLNDLSHIQSTQ